MANKNMIIALILSFIWSGLGLIYAEDMQKGIILAVLAVICYILMYCKSNLWNGCIHCLDLFYVCNLQTS